MTPIQYAADALIRYNGGYVLIERLSSVPGIALVGGKQEPGEDLWSTVIREVREETGLVFVPERALRTYADPARDPRGHFVTTLILGDGYGALRAEAGKTRPFRIEEHELPDYGKRMVLDYGQMVHEYLARL